MDTYFKKLSANEYEYYPEDKKYYSVNQKDKEENLHDDICVDKKAMAGIKQYMNTSSQKVECNLASLEKKGIPPMPVWNDKEHTETTDGKFKFITGRHAQFTQNSTQNNAMLLDLMKENYIWINEEQANQKGIKHGDLVEVTSKIGKVLIKAYPTNKIIKDVVFYVHGFGASSDELTLAHRNGASDNVIIEDTIEDVFGSAAMHETQVEIKRVES